MAARRNATDDQNDSAQVERAKIAATRAEVVDILAGAVFTLLIEGRAAGRAKRASESADEAAVSVAALEVALPCSPENAFMPSTVAPSRHRKEASR